MQTICDDEHIIFSVAIHALFLFFLRERPEVKVKNEEGDNSYFSVVCLINHHHIPTTVFKVVTVSTNIFEGVDRDDDAVVDLERVF